MARTHDMDRKHMMEMFRRAHEHQGGAFVEIYQNCNVFNDGAFEDDHGQGQRAPTCSSRCVTASRSASAPTASSGVVLDAFGECEIVEVADVGEDALLVHDETRDDPALAFALSRLAAAPTSRRRSACSGRSSGRPTRPRCSASSWTRSERQGPGDLGKLLGTGATWDVN